MKGLLVALLLTLVAPFAKAAPGTNPASLSASNFLFYGSDTYELETSTPTLTPVLLALGSGYLYSVDCSSGATTDYALAFDSNTASGVTIATLGKSLSPQVFSSGQSATGAGSAGQWAPVHGPTRFKLGLVLIKQGTGSNCHARALLDSTINAGGH